MSLPNTSALPLFYNIDASASSTVSLPAGGQFYTSASKDLFAAPAAPDYCVRKANAITDLATPNYITNGINNLKTLTFSSSNGGIIVFDNQDLVTASSITRDLQLLEGANAGPLACGFTISIVFSLSSYTTGTSYEIVSRRGADGSGFASPFIIRTNSITIGNEGASKTATYSYPFETNKTYIMTLSVKVDTTTVNPAGGYGGRTKTVYFSIQDQMNNTPINLPFRADFQQASNYTETGKIYSDFVNPTANSERGGGYCDRGYYLHLGGNFQGQIGQVVLYKKGFNHADWIDTGVNLYLSSKWFVQRVDAILPYLLKFDIRTDIDGETFNRPTFDYLIKSTFSAERSSITIGTLGSNPPSGYSLNIKNSSNNVIEKDLPVTLEAGRNAVSTTFETSQTFEKIILQLLANKWFNHPKAYSAINNKKGSSFASTLNACCTQLNSLCNTVSTTDSVQKAIKSIVEQFIDGKRSSNSTGAAASIQFVANDTITFLIYLTATPTADTDVTPLSNTEGMEESEIERFNIRKAQGSTPYEPIKLAIGLVLTAV